MQQDLTDITLIIDRSGSMELCKEDAVGGINAFIQEQKKADGDAVLTMIEFSDDITFVHIGQPIEEVAPNYQMMPCGLTALLDAVGKGIDSAGARLLATPEDQRPATVIFVIVTDGKENRSREYTRDQIRERIERQTNTYNWKFIYLGAGPESFSEGKSLGIDAASVGSYNASSKSADAYKLASSKVAHARSAVLRGGSADVGLSEEDRKSIS